MKKTILFILLLLILPITFASISTNPSIISLNPSNPSQSIEFIRTTGDNTTGLTLTVSSNLQNILQLNFNTVSFPSNTFITASINQNAPNGTYTGNIIHEQGNIPVSVFVQSSTNTTIITDGITVFPTSKVTTVQQGKEKTQNILISVPSNYPRPVTIEAADFNPGTETITFEDLNLGTINPGSSINIPIKFSGIDAQTGTYQTDLRLSAKDSQGSITLPSVSLTLQVTTGITAITDQTFSNPPACSLTTKDLTLNQSYSFTCSNAVSNIDITIPYNEYWQGNKVETSGGIYKYDFTPIKSGNTNFTATFSTKGASIFTSYNEPVRISNTGLATPGTILQLHYTPELNQSQGDEKILIQIIDNNTGSLVTKPKLYINAQEINTTSNTFEYFFETGKEYEIRGRNEGYNDIVQKININPPPINFTITPTSGSTNTIFSISTTPTNATLTINGQNINNPYFATLQEGNNTIIASYKGYKTTNTTIYVDKRITAIPTGGILTKGKEINISLSQNTPYSITYYEDINDITGDTVNTGNGNTISFTPEKKGIYQLEIEGITIATYETQGSFLTTKKLGLPVWLWITIVLGIIIIIILYMIIKNSGGNYPTAEGGGLHYNVGQD